MNKELSNLYNGMKRTEQLIKKYKGIINQTSEILNGNARKEERLVLKGNRFRAMRLLEINEKKYQVIRKAYIDMQREAIDKVVR